MEALPKHNGKVADPEVAAPGAASDEATNATGSAMGSNLPRPIGSHKMKRLEKDLGAKMSVDKAKIAAADNCSAAAKAPDRTKTQNLINGIRTKVRLDRS